MVLTDAGRVLMESTAGIVHRLEQARADVLACSGAPSGRVIIGMVPTVGGVLAARLAKRVVEQLPDVELRLVEAYGSYLTEWLHQGEVDLAVVYGPAQSLRLRSLALRHDELHVVSAIGSALDGARTVTLDQLVGRPLVLPSAPHALRLLIENAFAAHNAPLSVRIEADSFQALVEIVVAGVGSTFLPRYAVAGLIDRGFLVSAPVKPALCREIVLALPTGHQGSSASSAVAQIIRDVVSEL
jgi:DNA-binding transcriptional LysR family regulator